MSNDPFVEMEQRIRDGLYPPGARLPTGRELAEEFGVQRRTVMRTIARLVSAGLVEHEPGRRPVVSRAPAPVPSRLVSLLMPNEPRFHSFQTLMRGCSRELARTGHRLVFFDTYSATAIAMDAGEHRALLDLAEHPVAGAIIWAQNPETAAPALHHVREQGVPVVLVDRSVPGFPADFVGVDNYGAATDVAEHLWSLGHRRIGFVSWREHISAPLDREAGFRDALAYHGAPMDESLVFRVELDAGESLKAVAERVAAMPDRPTALFAINDILASALLDAFRKVNVRVPEDISLVGFDDAESLTLHRPVLTTVRQPYELIGVHAARILMRRIQTPEAPFRDAFLETRLIQRATVRPPRELVEDTLTSRPQPSRGEAISAA